MRKYLIGLTLYKTEPHKSLSIKSALNCCAMLKESLVIIHDNSPEPCSEESLRAVKDKLNIKYVHTPQNLYLSTVYNLFINELEGFEYLLLLDQDSVFTSDFFAEAENSMRMHPDVNLFLPIIKNGEQIVSPGRFILFKGKYFKNITPGLQRAQGTIAINSGMIINAKYMRKVFPGYDERFKYYGVDTYFMREYAKQNRTYFLLNYQLGHNLSVFHVEDHADNSRRLTDHCRGLLLLNREGLLKYFITSMYIVYFSLKNTLKYKSITYINILKCFHENRNRS